MSIRELLAKSRGPMGRRMHHPCNPAIAFADHGHGKVLAYAWPGGYPMYYLIADGEVMCPGCVQDNRKQCAGPEKWWRVVAHDVYWEGPPMQCSNCGEDIESAYGDPDSDDDESEG